LQAHIEALNKYLPRYELHVYAPLDSYNPNRHRYVLSRSIVFRPLPLNLKGPFEFIKKIPKIMHIFCQEFQKDDIVHSTATLYPPLGLIANILCLFKGCRKKLLVIDADTIGDLELLITLEKSVKKRLFYLVLKTLYALVLKFCIKLTPLTFVVGDALYERFKNYRRVVKIYASWVRRKDIIPSIRLLRKIEDLKRRDKIKLCFVAQLIPKKNPICAIYVARILKNNRVPFLIDIFGEGPMKKRLKRTCRKLNLADHVVFKGWSP